MRLVYSPASPFSRKARLIALEHGVPLDLDLRVVWSDDARVEEVNPLRKIPALVVSPDLTLFNSQTICAYLWTETLRRGERSWQDVNLEALADGALDAAVQIVYETTRRPARLSWPDWIVRQSLKVEGALDHLERATGAPPGGPFTIGEAALACAIGYLRWRLPGRWPTTRPGLDRWAAAVAERPSMRATGYEYPPGAPPPQEVISIENQDHGGDN